jgi:membrane-bound metal-dependent hydrolase YbcI (DUF457 family)
VAPVLAGRPPPRGTRRARRAARHRGLDHLPRHGILIGIDNLGYLFTNGYQRQIVAEILAGVVAVVVIALLVDWLLVLLGRLVLPWTRAVRA